MSETSTSGAAKPATSTPTKSGKSTALTGAELDRKRRVAFSTPEAAAELEALGVDPRLDNRTGDQRPQVAGPLKAQQFDGPEVGHFGEHADEHREEFAEATGGPTPDPLGMRAVGRHGRGEDDE